MWFRGASLCHVGALREHNEDACIIEVDIDMALVVVADAMGHASPGGAAGDLAIAKARELFADRAGVLAPVWWQAEHGTALPAGEREPIAAYIRGLLRSGRAATQGDVAVLAEDAYGELARMAVTAGNHAIWHRGQTSRSHRGQATTAELAIFGRTHVGIGHVGDSRSYRVRDGAITQLTRDHSLVNDYLLAMPDLTPEQIAEIPRNVIMHALGMAETVVVDTSVHALAPGDRFLFCTDGLWDLVPDEELCAAVERYGVGAARELVEAVAKRAPDNVTAVVVEVM